MMCMGELKRASLDTLTASRELCCRSIDCHFDLLGGMGTCLVLWLLAHQDMKDSSCHVSSVFLWIVIVVGSAMLFVACRAQCSSLRLAILWLGIFQPKQRKRCCFPISSQLVQPSWIATRFLP